MGQKLNDAVARARMMERGITPDPAIPYPGKDKPWSGACQGCGGCTNSSYGNVVIGGHKGCVPCGYATRKGNRIPDALARERMIERGIQPDSDVLYPGANTPWSGICLLCGVRVAPLYNTVMRSGG